MLGPHRRPKLPTIGAMTSPGQVPDPAPWPPPIPPAGEMPADPAGAVPPGPPGRHHLEPPMYPAGFLPPPRPKNRAPVVIAAVAVALVLVAGAVIAGVALLGSDTPPQDQAQSIAEPAAKTENHGIVQGSGAVVVDVYLDFSCPICAEFEADNGDLLAKAVADNEITLISHPLTILDGYSSTEYSTRAAAASVCAADEDAFGDYSRALFTKQPKEGGKGLSDSELIGTGTGIGLGDSFADCVTASKYTAWVTEGSDKTSGEGISAVPTVEMDGKPVVDRERFAEALAQALGR